MKKLFVFMILCLAFLLLVPGIVSAEGENNNNQVIDSVGTTKSGTTTITYGVAEYFQLTIPTNFNLDKNQAMYEDVVVSNVLIDPCTKVVVNVTSNNYNSSALTGEPAWRMKHEMGGDRYVSYHLHLADFNPLTGTYTVIQNGKVVSGVTEIISVCAEEFEDGNGRKEAYLQFFIPAGEVADYAGNYQDHLVFTATVVACDIQHSIQNP